MICYMDMTFCTFYTECTRGLLCPRALTPEIIKEAEELGLLVSQFTKKPECFISIIHTKRYGVLP